MDHHRWRWVPHTDERPNGKWRCIVCGALAFQRKPKTKQDYKAENVGRTCSLELVRRIHDA